MGETGRRPATRAGAPRDPGHFSGEARRAFEFLPVKTRDKSREAYVGFHLPFGRIFAYVEGTSRARRSRILPHRCVVERHMMTERPLPGLSPVSLIALNVPGRCTHVEPNRATVRTE